MNDDLISRKAAIDALIAEGRNVDSRYLESERIIHESDAVEAISLLPSAQPENKELLAWQEDFRGYIKMLNLPRDDYKGIMEYINDVPSAQPERKRGGFVGTEYDGYADGNPVYNEWECSECGCVFEDEEPMYNFCPNCGADMR